MTNEEVKDLVSYCRTGFDNVFDENEHYIEVVKEALEKQIKIKGNLYCPKCRRKMESTAYEWCPYCGTHIDWE